MPGLDFAFAPHPYLLLLGSHPSPMYLGISQIWEGCFTNLLGTGGATQMRAIWPTPVFAREEDYFTDITL